MWFAMVPHKVVVALRMTVEESLTPPRYYFYGIRAYLIPIFIPSIISIPLKIYKISQIPLPYPYPTSLITSKKNLIGSGCFTTATYSLKNFGLKKMEQRSWW